MIVCSPSGTDVTLPSEISESHFSGEKCVKNHIIFRVSKPVLLLAAYEEEEFFKVYHIDVGLLRSQSGLSYRAFAEGDRLFKEFKGALSENFVVQSLIRICGADPHYWANDKYEVDIHSAVRQRYNPDRS